MKRKNHNLKWWKSLTEDAKKSIRMAAVLPAGEKDEFGHFAARAQSTRQPGDKDVPAFRPGGGPGSIAKRRAKRFARVNGRRMSRGR